MSCNVPVLMTMSATAQCHSPLLGQSFCVMVVMTPVRKFMMFLVYFYLILVFYVSFLFFSTFTCIYLPINLLQIKCFRLYFVGCEKNMLPRKVFYYILSWKKYWTYLLFSRHICSMVSISWICHLYCSFILLHLKASFMCSFHVLMIYISFIHFWFFLNVAQLPLVYFLSVCFHSQRSKEHVWLDQFGTRAE